MAQFLRRLLFFVLLLSAHLAPASPPHIVLFIADDLGCEDCSCYGNTDVHTPNLDRLATQSLRFENAFAPSPTCTPSRSAIYTGLYPFRNGAHANHSLINEGLRTLPMFLKDLGYRVVLAGKSHIGPRESFPFEYLENSNIMPPGKHELLWTDLNTAAIEKLLAEHDPRKPLCLIVASHSPHVYWLPNDGYNPAEIKLPPYLLDTPQTRQARCRYYTDVTHMDSQLGDVLASLDAHHYTDNTLFIFTADQGAQFPFAKWNLYDAGIRAQLLVRWPGKTKPATVTPALVSLIDLLPTFIQAAGGIAPNDIDARSFLPVLLDKSQSHRDEIYAAHTGDGQMNRNPMRCIRTMQFKYILNLTNNNYTTHIDAGNGPDGRDYWNSWVKLAQTDPAAAALIERYHHRPVEELYDIRRDPYEQRNLAADPAHHDTLVNLREKLKQWRIQQGEDLNKIPMPEDARQGDLKYAG